MFLILHGIEGHAGNHWQQWLHDQLIKNKNKVIMPNLPKADHPNRKEWLTTIKKLTKNVDLNNLIIIAHSLSVATSLDFIETLNKPIKALISISGFADDYESELNSYFMKAKGINFIKVNKNIKKAFVIYGDNDPYVPQKTLKNLADKLKTKPTIILNGEHLNTDAGYTKFPLLLQLINNLF